MAQRARGSLRWFRHVNLLTSLVLIFPLLVAYQLALLQLPAAANGVDLITGQLVALLGTRTHYLLFNLAMVMLFVLLVLVLRRRQQFDLGQFVPVILESGFYALTMGTAIVHLMALLHVDPKLAVALPPAAQSYVPPADYGPITRFAMALGAGVHEELLFRLAMIPALTLGLEKLLGTSRWLALTLAFIVSSVLFSAAHHVIGGEPWALQPFVYRFFCGMLFAALFQFRGLAVAVYTHALYDVWVMVIR